jgi:hypothetical protein
MGERRGAYRDLVWKPEGDSSLGRAWHRREDNIKTGLQELGWDMDRIELVQVRN